MAQHLDDLIHDIQSQIGLDAYHIYPNQRRLIPEAVLWGFASACLLEFLRGLVDVKGLGEAVRMRVADFLSAWQSKTGFEAAVTDPKLPDTIGQVLAALPGPPTHEQRSEATLRLAASLHELGIPAPTAKQHAERIAALIGDVAAER